MFANFIVDKIVLGDNVRINDKENYLSIRNSISMTNLKKIINAKGYLITKAAINSKVSESTLKSYMNGQKIPSIPTLISLADFLNCNLDYLLDRTDNPIKFKDITKINNNQELNQLLQNIVSLPSDKQQLVIAYVKGLLNN